jgi:hypothetical protein
MYSKQRILIISLVLVASTLAHNHLENHYQSNTNVTGYSNSTPDSDPDISKTFQQIVQENGFAFEEHQVTTDDGYILKVFRIPGT